MTILLYFSPNSNKERYIIDCDAMKADTSNVLLKQTSTQRFELPPQPQKIQSQARGYIWLVESQQSFTH